MFWLVIAEDKADSLSLRLENRDAHLRHAAGEHGLDIKLVVGGPLGENGMNGSFLIYEADSKSTVQAVMDQDPYSEAGLFASVSIWAINDKFDAAKFLKLVD